MIDKLKELQLAKRDVESQTPRHVSNAVQGSTVSEIPIVTADNPIESKPELSATESEPSAKRTPKARWVFPRRLIEIIVNFLLRVTDVPTSSAAVPAEDRINAVGGRSRSSADQKNLKNDEDVEATTLVVSTDSSSLINPNIKNRLKPGNQRKFVKPQKSNATDDADYNTLGVTHDYDDEHELMELFDLYEYYDIDDPEVTLWTKEGEIKQIVKVKKVGNDYVIVTTEPPTEQPIQGRNMPDSLHIGELAARAKALDLTTLPPSTPSTSTNSQNLTEATTEQMKPKTTTENCTVDEDWKPELPSDDQSFFSTFAPLSSSKDSLKDSSLAKNVLSEPVTFPYPPIENLVTLKPVEPKASELRENLNSTEVASTATQTTVEAQGKDSLKPSGKAGTKNFSEDSTQNQDTTTEFTSGFEEYYAYEEYETSDPPSNETIVAA